ncbi:MAG: carbonic anhydrase [Rhodocyclaceae bacterium]|nr:carbonic anhydrase [Rhodocyclaceae bacterium]
MGHAVAKHENILTPSQALERLLSGNARYLAGVDSPDSFQYQPDTLAESQNPYACILGCADSRVSPEHCFDEGQGDLFVTRIAGNFVTQEILGSLEYGTAVLGASLIMVLGHTGCGAIGAAIKAVDSDEDFPGHIQGIATALSPAVTQATSEGSTDSRAVSATRINVALNVDKLRNATPVLRKLVREERLRIVGGLYHVATGAVEIIVD